MNERILIKQLTINGAIITKNKYIIYEEQEIPVGDPWQRAYVNSVLGREEVAAEVPEPYRSAIIAVWGTEPTVDESIED